MSNYLKADGFDSAIIGIDSINERIIYSKQKMIDVLINDDMSEEDAIEFLEFNTWNAWVGDHTPIYCDEMDLNELEEYIENNC